jgi:hypothetical protein
MKKESMLDVFQRNQYNLHRASRKSRSWFEQQVNIIGRQGITPMKAFTSESTTLRTSIVPGELYMFFYSAKHKETLPYWDKFPMVIPFATAKGGFLGLNLHYLQYDLRIQLMDRLLTFKSNDTLDERTKLKFSWATVEGMSKFAAVKPCVKHYLNGYVKSSFKKIDADDWATALLLPVESFVGASKQQVWYDSRRIMRK